MRHYKMRQQWRGTETERRMLQIQALHGRLKQQSAAAKQVTLAEIDGIVSQLHGDNLAGEYDPIAGKFVEETGYAKKRS